MTSRARLQDGDATIKVEKPVRTRSEQKAYEKFVERIEEAFPYLNLEARAGRPKRGLTAANRPRRRFRGHPDD